MIYYIYTHLNILVLCPFQGPRGYPGLKGEKGSAGFAFEGDQGVKGEKGDRGPPGSPAVYHFTGPKGNTVGLPGENGDKGDRVRHRDTVFAKKASVKPKCSSTHTFYRVNLG